MPTGESARFWASEGDIDVARPQLRVAPGKMPAAGLIIEGMSVLVRMLSALQFRTIRGGRETGVVRDAKRGASSSRRHRSEGHDDTAVLPRKEISRS